MIVLTMLCIPAFGQTTAEEWFNKGVELSQYYTELDNAVKAFDEAIALNPNYAEAYFHKGLALYAEGYARDDGNPEAMKAFDEAFRLNPNDAEMWINYGKLFNSYYKTDDAVKAFDEATRLDPNNSTAWFLKGWALEEQGILINSTHHPGPSGYTAADKSTYDQDKLNEALAAFDEAIRLNPKSEDAYFQRWHVLLDLGRDAEADAASKTAYAIRNKGNTG